MFKGFVTRYRPHLDIEAAATGEHWFGIEALERGLVDELLTSDDYLMKRCESHAVYSVKYVEKKTLGDRISEVVGSTVAHLVERLRGRFSTLG